MIAVRPQEVEVAPDLSRCWSHFSHQSFDDFGRTECYRHWKIARVFEAGRQFAMTTDVTGLESLINEQSTIFALGVQYHIVPELWSVRAGTGFPYKVSAEISDLGRTSVSIYSEMVNKLDNRIVATAHCKLIYVDWATRRPTPFPDWYFQKYTPFAMRHKRPLSLTTTVPEIPPSAHCHTMEVAASDVDFHWHANQGSYVRFCCDAAQAAVTAQALSGFQRDIARYPLIEQQVVYFGECGNGDQLQVYVWQQPGHTEKVLFVIKKRNAGKPASVIFQAYMIFQMKQVALPTYARM